MSSTKKHLANDPSMKEGAFSRRDSSRVTPSCLCSQNVQQTTQNLQSQTRAMWISCGNFLRREFSHFIHNSRVQNLRTVRAITRQG
jgi:hypothetical protein